jgi:hypothetical protein
MIKGSIKPKRNNMKRIILSLFMLNPVFFTSLFAQLEHSKNINVTVEVQRELFPVIEKFIAVGNIHSNIPGLVTWRIHNSTNKLVRISLISEIPGWAAPVITTVDLYPDQNKELMQSPFGINLLSNHILAPATILLRAKVDEKIIFQETRNLNIRAVDDMIWSLNSPWDTESLIASWVTPNDPMVEEILSVAKEMLPGKKLPGYSSSDVREEVKAIFNAVSNYKISYVNSAMYFGQVGFTQRVKLPEESISEKSVNCIDGAVLFASLFENIGLQPLIILTNDHAFAGVRLAPNSKGILCIEITIAGRPMVDSSSSFTAAFEDAVKEATGEYNYSAQNGSGALRIIDIKRARAMRIYPLR